MSDELEKAHKLIALAVDKSASESEARNAALLAVKLISEHKLLPQHPPQRVAEAPKPKTNGRRRLDPEIERLVKWAAIGYALRRAVGI